MRRARFLIGIAVGVGAVFAAYLVGARAPTMALAGSNVGSLVYIVLTWRVLLSADETEVRQRAAEEDEPPFAILAIVIGAIAASLGAIVWTLIRAKTGQGLEKALAPSLAVLTLVVSWVLMQTVFVLHYAHRHFGDRNRDGSDDGGFDFPGQPPRTYHDFIYLAFCIGATFQVSDTGVARSNLRNLVAVHSATAYFYNTAVLALGINIVAGLLGH